MSNPVEKQTDKDVADAKTSSASETSSPTPEKLSSPVSEQPTAPSNSPSSSSKSDATPEAKPEKKKFWTWERTIEILKLVVTIWAAFLGSYVTMEFNQRQNELNRIQAIAQMLPHMHGSPADISAPKSNSASKSTSIGIQTSPNASTDKDQGQDDAISREGAFWAIFRTAKDRVMLRDLAALFPLDIYRVISSIAVAGELDNDADATVALEVASEKLAEQYSEDPSKAQLASRLYAQALALRKLSPQDPSRLHIVDLTSASSNYNTTGDQMAALLKSINDLADAHYENAASPSKGKSNTSRSNSVDLYRRARQLGQNSDDQQVLEQVARADLALCTWYVKEGLADDAFRYLKEEIGIEAKITGKPSEEYLKAADKNGDGFASLAEIQASLTAAQARLHQIFIDFPDKGVPLNQ